MIRGILTLLMLIGAYSFASFDEGIDEVADIELELSSNSFEGTVVDVRHDETGTYHLIHLRSGDLEWAINYYNFDNNVDSGLMALRQIATEQAMIRIELDCPASSQPYLQDTTVNQGRIVRHIHIVHNDTALCQILSSRAL